MTPNEDLKTKRDMNPDPITKAPGSHPVATGIGAAAAGAAGAAIGSIVPGVGTVIGGVVGAIAGSVGGGYAGKAVGEAIDPTGDEEHWREHHKTRQAPGSSYDTYRPAYEYGASLADRGEQSSFDEPSVRSGWDSHPGKSDLSYDDARETIRGEFDRKSRLREQRTLLERDRAIGGTSIDDQAGKV